MSALRMWLRVLAIVFAVALIAAACGDDDDGAAETTDEADAGEDIEAETPEEETPEEEAEEPEAEEGQAEAPEEEAEAEPESSDAAPLSVALLIGGPRNDGGFYQAMVDGLEGAAAADGAMEVTVIEQIAEGGDAALEAAVENAASSGDFDLIVAHGFDLVPGVARYAPDYPEQAFAASLPIEGADNVGVYLSAFHETGYNAGFLAAQGTKGGKVAFMGGPGLDFELQAEHGFRQAIEQYAPGTEVEVVYTGTFEDPQLAQETATQLFADGVDSLWNQQAAGQGGVYQACAEAGAAEGTVACFGNSPYSVDVSADVVLASTQTSYDILVPIWAERLRSGTWGPDIDLLNIANGGTSVTEATAAGEALLPDLSTAIADFKAGAADIVVEPLGQ
ncbi:MAG: BMP family protein [Acidimicrobiales bacterium]